MVWKFQRWHHVCPSNCRQLPHRTRGAATRVFSTSARLAAVSDCCTPRGYSRLFSERGAQRQASRYRRSGLDAVSAEVARVVRDRGVAGASVIEVGGGIGAVQLELLKAGAAATTSIELTPTYESEATALLRENGLEDRSDRRIMDFAEAGAGVGAADVVVLNRVVCCYHDMPKLAGAAAEHARRLLVLSFPKERLWTRALLAAGNAGLWIARQQFHVFLHSPAAIRRVAEGRGLRAVYDHEGLFWQVVAFERA